MENGRSIEVILWFMAAIGMCATCVSKPCGSFDTHGSRGSVEQQKYRGAGNARQDRWAAICDARLPQQLRPREQTDQILHDSRH